MFGESSCKCFMPTGWWSSGGWHLRRMTSEECERKGAPQTMVGEPIAVERCAAYQATVEQNIRADKMENAARSRRVV